MRCLSKTWGLVRVQFAISNNRNVDDDGTLVEIVFFLKTTQPQKQLGDKKKAYRPASVIGYNSHDWNSVPDHGVKLHDGIA